MLSANPDPATETSSTRKRESNIIIYVRPFTRLEVRIVRADRLGNIVIIYRYRQAVLYNII